MRGEALLEKAKENYKKSVELNPGNEHGLSILKKLDVNIEGLIQTVSLEELKLLTGEYLATNKPKSIEGDWKVVFEIKDGVLYGNDRGYQYKLLPVGRNEFVNPDDGASIIFNTDDGNVVTMVLFEKFKFKKMK